MIEYIKGVIAELTPAYAVIDNHGIGYMINISLYSYETLQKQPNGETILYIHEAIREDAHILYGFANKLERELFLLLISVSGVGPNSKRYWSKDCTTHNCGFKRQNKNRYINVIINDASQQ